MSTTKNLAVTGAVLSAGGMMYMVGNSPDQGELLTSTAKRAWDALSENPTATGVVALFAFFILCAYLALKKEKNVNEEAPQQAQPQQAPLPNP